MYWAFFFLIMFGLRYIGARTRITSVVSRSRLVMMAFRSILILLNTIVRMLQICRRVRIRWITLISLRLLRLLIVKCCYDQTVGRWAVRCVIQGMRSMSRQMHVWSVQIIAHRVIMEVYTWMKWWIGRTRLMSLQVWIFRRCLRRVISCFVVSVSIQGIHWRRILQIVRRVEPIVSSVTGVKLIIIILTNAIRMLLYFT